MRTAVAVTLALAFAVPAQAAFVQFRTPSANIGCAWGSDNGGYLRCDILSGLKPRPPKPRGCRLDWAFGFQMARTGRASTVCAGDTAVDKRARVLRYGSKWSRGGFTCTSRLAGLRCSNSTRHGFFLSRARSYRF